MHLSKVRQFQTVIRATLARLHDVTMELTPEIEGGEAYWLGLTAAASMCLLRLDEELSHEVMDRNEKEVKS